MKVVGESNSISNTFCCYKQLKCVSGNVFYDLCWFFQFDITCCALHVRVLRPTRVTNALIHVVSSVTLFLLMSGLKLVFCPSCWLLLDARFTYVEHLRWIRRNLSSFGLTRSKKITFLRLNLTFYPKTRIWASVMKDKRTNKGIC
jgi:hypothetical protein